MTTKIMKASSGSKKVSAVYEKFFSGKTATDEDLFNAHSTSNYCINQTPAYAVEISANGVTLKEDLPPFALLCGLASSAGEPLYSREALLYQQQQTNKRVIRSSIFRSDTYGVVYRETDFVKHIGLQFKNSRNPNLFLTRLPLQSSSRLMQMKQQWEASGIKDGERPSKNAIQAWQDLRAFYFKQLYCDIGFRNGPTTLSAGTQLTVQYNVYRGSVYTEHFNPLLRINWISIYDTNIFYHIYREQLHEACHLCAYQLFLDDDGKLCTRSRIPVNHFIMLYGGELISDPKLIKQLKDSKEGVKKGMDFKNNNTFYRRDLRRNHAVDGFSRNLCFKDKKDDPSINCVIQQIQLGDIIELAIVSTTEILPDFPLVVFKPTGLQDDNYTTGKPLPVATWEDVMEKMQQAVGNYTRSTKAQLADIAKQVNMSEQWRAIVHTNVPTAHKPLDKAPTLTNHLPKTETEKALLKKDYEIQRIDNKETIDNASKEDSEDEDEDEDEEEKASTSTIADFQRIILR